MRRPSIVFLNRVYPPVHGATGRLLRDVCNAFVRAGWHVTVISSAPFAEERYEDGVHIICVKGEENPQSVYDYMGVWFKMLWAALRLRQRDVVVTKTDPPILYYIGYLVAKLNGSAHIHWSQDVYPDLVPVMGRKIPNFVMRFFKKCRRKALDNAHSIIVNGRCMGRYLASTGLDVKKIIVIPNWPDWQLSEAFAVQLDQEAVAQSEYGQDIRCFDDLKKGSKGFRVLYAGNLGSMHPVETMVEAAAILEEQGSDIEFVFVGEGARYDELLRCRDLRGLHNIRFLPRQPLPRLRELMLSGNVHIVSMDHHALGLLVPSKLYSALAVGRPCIFIGPEKAETAQVITEFGAGMVIAQGDAKNLAQSILDLRNNENAWQEAHQGALKARDVFAPNTMMGAIVDEAWDAVAAGKTANHILPRS